MDLEQLYASYATAAFRRSRALLGNDDEAWDIVQDLFTKLAAGTITIEAERPLPFITRAITNLCFNQLNRRSVRDRYVASSLKDSVYDNAAAISAMNLLRALEPELDELDRQLLLLKVLGMTQEEAATALGVVRKTIERRLQRIRELALKHGSEDAKVIGDD